jgi:hypothetical protein
MVRNKREFWERSDTHGIENGYELGYQFWVSFGLAKGALVASMIGDSATGRRWSQASEAMSAAMLEDPKFRLIEDGHFIKRRTIDGRWQRYLRPPDRGRLPPGSPIATEANPSTEPDTTTVLPILYEMIDPRSNLARKTLAWVEQLWNQQWATGGYPRYNVTGEDNPPAPWPIASMLVARAYAAAGDDSKVWRVLDWLHTIHGGASGSWFERYGPSITPPMPPVGVVGWIWYEIIGLWMHHVAGIRPEIDVLVVKPRLLSGLNDVSATALVRGTRIDLEVHRTSGISKATVDGKEFPMENGSLRITYVKKKERTVRIELA